MPKFAQLDAAGVVIGVVSTFGSAVAGGIPFDTEAVEIGCTAYQDGAFVDIGHPPTACHVFDGQGWRLDADRLAAEILTTRRRLLTASDWTQLPDVPLTTKAAWAAYRQALRDITDQPGYPLNVAWPQQP